MNLAFERPRSRSFSTAALALMAKLQPAEESRERTATACPRCGKCPGLHWDRSAFNHMGTLILVRQNPVHWNRTAIPAWTLQTERSELARATDYLNVPASDDLAALNALAFVIERVPATESIEPPKNTEFIGRRNVEMWEGSHARDNNSREGAEISVEGPD